MRFKEVFKNHIKDNLFKYIFIVAVLAIGIFLGNYKSTALEGGVRGYLLELVDNYLDYSLHLEGNELFLKAFLNQAEMLLLIWFLGLTVIGFPLILAVVFFRGFSLGFTTGFLIHEKAGSGVIIALLSVLPQNLVYIPLFIFWAVTAFDFSLYILKGNQNQAMPLFRGIFVYTLLLLAVLFFLALGALIEAYLVPWFLSIVF
ncbi:stage II sporulation protein M [Thermosyntropha sp.]|uniref:stage II sporulation protein M n=1 Tax=Thermosyntropha sp. TaxID=2740820 RepID=UPI0025FB2FF4|nr:stage II sporulation protein M [Thermosyntropha sp.]MBO8159169.1 stage II sporulation protein M [Thermosyntropha sp.]